MFNDIKAYIEFAKAKKNPNKILPIKIEGHTKFYYEGGFYLDTTSGATNVPESEWINYFFYHPEHKEETIMSIKELAFFRSKPLPGWVCGL